MRKRIFFPAWLLPALTAVCILAGCNANYYRKSADRAAYSAIRAKSPLVANMDTNFTIETAGGLSLDDFPVSTNVHDYLGSEAETERGARILRLEEALYIAIHHSRAYQNRKETLYLAGLALDLDRHEFEPIFSARGEGDYIVGTSRVIISSNGVVLADRIVEDRRLDGRASIDANWLIRDVGRLSAAFTTDALRFVTGDPRITTSSELTADFVRPLLRDAGFKNDREALIQAERNLLYEIRDFTQFRKDFSVGIAEDYYNVLGRRDEVRNSYLNIQSSRKNAERVRAMVEQGRSTTAELGRLEQQELNAESSWINSIRSYKQALDDLKIQMGLSVEANIVLDDRELEALHIQHPDISVDDSIKVALAARLDFMNVKDELEDAERKVALARNSLKPQIDISARAGIISDRFDRRGVPLPDPDRYSYSAGLLVDPGLDRVSQRNTYRARLIDFNRAERNIIQQSDEIKSEVRESWRTLDQAKRNYEISEIGVRIAERRVEEQDLLAEVGRARAQDQVDAQNDLIESRNERIQALVTHTIARLRFWNNMGILYIKDNGQWEEMQHERN